MPDTKITALTAIGANPIIPATFPIPMVDLTDTSMAASGTTKKVTVNQILGAGGTATLASATITGDLTVDTSTLKVDSTNNRVGIGTATPGFPLHVQSATAVFKLESSTGTNPAYLYTTSTGGDFYFGRDNSTGATFGTGTGYSAVVYSANAYPMVFFTNAIERYRIASDGVATWSNVGGVAGTAMTLNATGLGVGASPTSKLTIGTGSFSAAASGTTGMYTTASGLEMLSDSYFFGSRTGGGLMKLDASGNLLVGKTSSSLGVVGVEARPNGEVWSTNAASTDGAGSSYILYSTGATAYRFYVGMGGTVFATNTTISGISDARLKENVQDLDVGLGEILALKPRKFDWKEGKGKNIKGDRGFIAQEFETVFPNLIDEWKDEAPEGEAPYKSVRQDLIPVLVKAIQELTARVQTLEAK